MSISLNAYLNFMGQAKDAMDFYKSIFGGELNLTPYDDNSALTMHAELKSQYFTFFASDGNEEHQVHPGDNVQMSLSGDDTETLTDYFNGLANGGQVTMPLAKAPWGDTFGMLTDKFGIHWMINITAKK